MIDLDRIVSVARQRGMDATSPVIVSIKNEQTNQRYVRFIVAYSEPHSELAPMNVLWIVADPAAQDFMTVYRRMSRLPENGSSLQNTWVKTSNYFTTQVWDIPPREDQEVYDHATLFGNVFNALPQELDAVSRQGEQLEGPLIPRQLDVGEQYSNEEVVPRSFIEQALMPLRQITNMLQQWFSNLNAQLTSVRNRVTVVEQRLQDTGGAGFTFTADEPMQEWSINHNLDSAVSIQVFEDSELVWPSSIKVIDSNNVVVRFAEPIRGAAQILPV